jgi:Anti-sigma-K factor rskA
VTSRPLDQLSPESRAVLSLVLLQSRSYAEIAGLLRLGEDDVRDRAHAAARQLAETDEPPSELAQARIIDYLLGEQSVSERAETRTELLHDPIARAWATRLADELTPIAKTPLPAIPGGEAPAPVSEPPKRATRRSIAHDPVSPTPPARTRADRRPSARWVAIAAIVIAVAVIVIIVASSGGGKARTSATSRSTTTTAPSGGGQTIAKLILTPVGSNHSALGAGAVESQNGHLMLLLQAHGLAPNTLQNSYGVWLYNGPTDARLLGFVAPSVGRSGKFANNAVLPAGASRFHALIVTLETSSQPTKPGPVVLRAPLSLP